MDIIELRIKHLFPDQRRAVQGLRFKEWTQEGRVGRPVMASLEEVGLVESRRHSRKERDYRLTHLGERIKQRLVEKEGGSDG
jgi:DNA-binding PadR family transcriptional regulator